MEDFVTLKQAKLLKELGFDCKTYAFYTEEGNLYLSDNPDYWNDEIWNKFSAPTLAQAQKWLREKHNRIILVDTYFKNYMEGDYSKAEFEYVIVNMNFNAARKGSSRDDKIFETYEQALSAGIDTALELISKEIQRYNGRFCNLRASC